MLPKVQAQHEFQMLVEEPEEEMVRFTVWRFIIVFLLVQNVDIAGRKSPLWNLV